MPTYEYRCEFCHQLSEAFQKMSDAPLTTCPHCGKEGLHRLVSGGAGVLYKGEGWYVTDYSKKSSGGKDMPSTSSPASPAPPKTAGEASGTSKSSDSSSTTTPETKSTPTSAAPKKAG